VLCRARAQSRRGGLPLAPGEQARNSSSNNKQSLLTGSSRIAAAFFGEIAVVRPPRFATLSRFGAAAGDSKF
jgi:hypothetical protein